MPSTSTTPLPTPAPTLTPTSKPTSTPTPKLTLSLPSAQRGECIGKIYVKSKEPSEGCETAADCQCLPS